MSRKTVTTTHSRFTVAESTSEKVIGLMQAPYEKIVAIHDAETGEEIPQKSPSTILRADGYSRDGAAEACVIEFSERGYTVLSDTRRLKVGYLHICDESAGEISERCRDQIIRYMFSHPDGLPGIGRTTQKQYFAGLSTADVERIGNEGRKAYYN